MFAPKEFEHIRPIRINRRVKIKCTAVYINDQIIGIKG